MKINKNVLNYTRKSPKCKLLPYTSRVNGEEVPPLRCKLVLGAIETYLAAGFPVFPLTLRLSPLYDIIDRVNPNVA
jgi:hypothetical protein